MALPDHTNARVILISALLFSLFIGVPGTLLAEPADDIKQAIKLRDYEEAARLLLILVDSGDVDAAYQLASLYRSGRGVEKDHKKAFNLLKQSAAKGHIKAMYNLGTMYEHGWGTIRDSNEALIWYQSAAEGGNSQAKKKVEILSKDNALTVTANSNLGNSLLKAAATGDTTLIKQLIAGSVDKDYTNEQGISALYEAVVNKRLSTAKVLLQSGANANIANRLGDTPLITAVKGDYLPAVTLLIDHKADINKTDRHGNSPLIIAASKGNRKITKLLISRRAKINLKNNSGETALLLANLRGHKNVASTLIASGAKRVQPQKEAVDIAKLSVESSKTYSDWPLLNVMALRGEIDTVKQIITSDKNIDTIDPEGYTPLFQSIMGGHPEITSLLLESGADIHYRSLKRETFLHLAAKKRSIELTNIALANKIDIDAQDHEGKTALFVSVVNADEPVTQRLLQRGANPNLVDKFTTSPLVYAVQKGYCNIATQLIKKQADPLRLDKNGYSPIWHAVSSRKLPCIQAFNGIPQVHSYTSPTGDTLLIKAIEENSEDIFNLLLSEEVDIDSTNKNGNNVLMVAASKGLNPFIELSLRKSNQLEIDKRNKIGNTALILAATNGHLATVKLLLDKGANPLLRNSLRENAIDKANQNQHTKIVELLEKSGKGGTLFKLFQ